MAPMFARGSNGDPLSPPRRGGIFSLLFGR